MIYIIIQQHFRSKTDIAILLLDQSNAYGQCDIQALKIQADCDPALRWALAQSVDLYSRLRPQVVTTMGLSSPYIIGGGLIQGGGMDPFWYVFYTVMLFMGLVGFLKGVCLCTGEKDFRITIQAVVDDTIIFSNDIKQLRNDIPKIMTQIKTLNGKCNPLKLNLLILTFKMANAWLNQIIYILRVSLCLQVDHLHM